MTWAACRQSNKERKIKVNNHVIVSVKCDWPEEHLARPTVLAIVTYLQTLWNVIHGTLMQNTKYRSFCHSLSSSGGFVSTACWWRDSWDDWTSLISIQLLGIFRLSCCVMCRWRTLRLVLRSLLIPSTQFFFCRSWFRLPLSMPYITTIGSMDYTSVCALYI